MAKLPTDAAYLVNAYADPVIVRIIGRATYLNCAPLSDFFRRLIAQGKRSFVIDFHECTAMDSTFLGLLAGAGMEIHKLTPPGTFVLTRLGARNLELVRNLGIHRIMTVDAGDFQLNFDGPKEQLQESAKTDIENARMILTAHENLVAVDRANEAKFQDVILFLKGQIGNG
ncbi:MAG: STAS domain-containing protein [Verrucomicrobiota bacterium]|nr:STAS domain-containing protein [Verrucomicrobiota bacterium]